MKASKLISLLQSQVELYGDMDVEVVDAKRQSHRIDTLTYDLFNMQIILTK